MKEKIDYKEGWFNAQKYIEQLEQKLEQTEKDLADYQFNYPKIKEFAQKNTELKESNEYKNKACVKLAHQANVARDNLDKAKELLNEFMRISKASDEDFEHDYSELIGETEQFIKEIEK